MGDIALAPDGSWIASSGTRFASNEADPAVRLWDSGTGQLKVAVDTGHQYGLERVAVAPDGTWIATLGRTEHLGFGELMVRIWDVTSGGLRHEIAAGHQLGSWTHLVAAPDSSWLATMTSQIGGTAIHIWDVATGLRRRTMNVGQVRGREHLLASSNGA